MTKRLGCGDIVVVEYPLSGQNGGGRDIGMVYDFKNNESQIIYMTPEDKRGRAYSVKVNSTDLIKGSLSQDYFLITERVFLLRNDSILKKIGRVSVRKVDEVLRKMAHNIVDKHYNAVHKKSENFIPGKTYIRYAGRVYDDQEMKALINSCLDFWLTAGRFTKQFEEKFAKFLGARYCILTNSGSSANLLAISALTSPKLGKRRLKSRDEVITTACAFPTTVNPIIQNNLIPVFLDVDIGTYNIQVDKIEDALSEKTKAIFLAHTLGNPFDLDKVLGICEKHNLWLVEDSCDALGSKHRGRYTGTFGHIATFSFYPAHHITMGEGGALVTSDPELRRLIISFRDWGRDCWCEAGHDNTCDKRFGWQLGSLPYGYDHKFIYSHIGYNLKATDMQAAIGVEQLNKLPSFIKARRKNFRLLREGLEGYEEYLILPKTESRAEPSWFGFPIMVRRNTGFTRDEIVKYLEDNKIATRMLFAGNIIRHPCFEGVDCRVYGNLVNTDKIMNDSFWIGVYPGISEREINYILSVFRDFFNKPSK